MARFRIGIAVLIVGLGLAPSEPAASGQGVIGSGLDGFQAWLDLARRHAPGLLDDAIVQEREIPLERHFMLAVDLEALLEFIRDPDLSSLKKGRRAYSQTEQTLLQRIAKIERAAGTTDRLLRQIALLESDAVMLAGGQKFIVASPSSKVPKDMVLSADGISLELAVTPPNWQIARTALDAMSADPVARRWIHQWYVATTAYLFYDRVWAVIPQHVAAWQRVLPDDGEAWFHEGCAFEVFGSSRIQHARLDARRKGREVSLETSYWNLRHARRRFEQALERDPRHVEARLRLARVKLLLGETRAAVKELVAVLPDFGSDRELLYLGHLFLGAAQESSGDLAGAKVAYREAVNLYPLALSPHLSRVGLETPSNDAADHDETVADLLRQKRNRSDDPWLSYQLGPGRFSPNLATALWAASRAP